LCVGRRFSAESLTRAPGNIDVLNLTDQRNWIPNGDAHTASALIIQVLPLRVQGYVKFKF